MKKILSLMLVFLLAVSLTACGSQANVGRTAELKIARLGSDEGWRKRFTGNLYISGIILNCSWGRSFPIGF